MSRTPTILPSLFATTRIIGIGLAKEGLVKAYRTEVLKFDEIENNQSVDTSYLGTQVMSNLIFGDLNNKSNNKYIQIDGTEKTFEALKINDVLIDVTQTKNNIKTSIQGRNGTIKQYINDGDYLINVKGRITATKINEQNIYPATEVSKLVKILSIPDSISVTCLFLQYFGIQRVVIDSYKLAQSEGILNQQDFEITMSSDNEINLEYVPPTE